MPQVWEISSNPNFASATPIFLPRLRMLINVWCKNVEERGFYLLSRFSHPWNPKRYDLSGKNCDVHEVRRNGNH